MRILHVAYIYPPTLRVADGITNVVYNVTKELVRRGHQVEVYASDMLDLHGKDSLYAKHLVINGVNVHYSRSLWRYKTFMVTPSIVPLLSKNIDNFDIIHIHDCRSFQGISTYLLAKTKNIPYVFQPHGSYLFTLPESLTTNIGRCTLDKFISGKIVKNASKVIALSQMEAEQYRGMGVPDEKIEVIPNGIDLSEYGDLPPKGCFKRKFGIDEDEKIVLYLGRIHRIKGIDILVRAFADVIEKLDDVRLRLVVVGPDDGYLGELEALTKALKIEDNVLILGPLYGKDKLEAYVDADVYVLPSRYETFPMSLLEAYACGKPVIASMTGGLKDLVMDRVTGLLIKPSDVRQFADSICCLLDNNYNKAQEMGLRGKRFVKENFSVEKVTDKLERIYERVIIS